MKTLDRYVAKEMLVPFAAGFLVVLVLLVGNIVYNNIAVIVAKIQQWPDVLYFILLQTPYFVVLALPSGALFGCTLGISRLARDSEVTMMRMAGLSVKRIILPMLVMGFLISMVAYAFQEGVTVWAERESVRILKKLWLAPGPLPVQANVFSRVDNYFFYVNTVERQSGRLLLHDIMIYEPPTGRGFPQLTTAAAGTEHGRMITLTNGTIYRVSPAGEPELVGHFRRMRLDLRRALSDYLLQEQKSPKAMTIAQLRQQMGLREQGGLATQAYSLEYNYKLAIPLSSLVLMLCVAPLSIRFGRSGGFMGVLIGIVVLFFYWNAILFSRVLGETGGLPPALAGWSEVIIFGVLGGFLMWKVE